MLQIVRNDWWLSFRVWDPLCRMPFSCKADWPRIRSCPLGGKSVFFGVPCPLVCSKTQLAYLYPWNMIWCDDRLWVHDYIRTACSNWAAISILRFPYFSIVYHGEDLMMIKTWMPNRPVKCVTNGGYIEFLAHTDWVYGFHHEGRWRLGHETRVKMGYHRSRTNQGGETTLVCHCEHQQKPGKHNP